LPFHLPDLRYYVTVLTGVVSCIQDGTIKVAKWVAEKEQKCVGQPGR